ncbi:methenyltetrahydromethanopterin cyclohydrolase [Candidatus Bathyarchaeota archaeon]|nr:methenyltetrahydromethanopterin cyclohydrolase [Candidatus Bathyarchaeota archaeon]
MLSVNKLAAKICRKMIDEAEELNIKYTCLKNGVHIIDTGNQAYGGVQAGLYVTKICLGGLGNVALTSMELEGITLPAIGVSTDFPIFSILCQASGGYREAMDGWINFNVGSYNAIASGPARAIVHEPEELFEIVGYKDFAEVGVVVLQSEQYPDEKVADRLVERCKVDPASLYLVLSPLSSMSGLVQVTGRSVENAMVKLRTLDYNVKNVKYACGIAPLPPLKSPKIIPDDMLSYGSVVHLYIMPDEKTDLREIAKKMPSRTSKCYGRSFVELVKEHGGWRGIDIDLFAPAEIYINNLKTGEIYKFGDVNSSLLKTMVGLN